MLLKDNCVQYVCVGDGIYIWDLFVCDICCGLYTVNVHFIFFSVKSCCVKNSNKAK